MWIPRNTGVFLHHIDAPKSDNVVIKLVREQSDDIAHRYSTDRFSKTTTMTLHVKNDDTKEYTLNYDSWSDINVIPDGSIDDKDLNAITQLGLAFYHQSAISSDQAAFLFLDPEDLVEVFDPAMPIGPITPSTLSVRMQVLDMDDNEEPEVIYYVSALSFDEGASFDLKKRYGGDHRDYEPAPGLEDLVKAFIKLKL